MGDPDIIIERLKQIGGNVAYDIGGNVGEIAKILSHSFELVYSFEPAQESFVKLYNLSKGIQNIIPVPLAISESQGEIELDVSSKSIRKGQLVSGDYLESWGEKIGTRKVMSTTIDEFIRSHPPPDFVKIDVEGHEMKVISGGFECIRVLRPRLFIEVHSNYLGDSIRKALASFYDFEIIYHTAYSPESPRKRNHYFMFSRSKGQTL
ncbi:MAG: FkbM family methyltransferase [Nitrososphaerota archaeon]|jgi:FkbM family methyltransferase|nr:FkbM family methyltransferase [Nitrososphaerota archaeon]